MRQSSLCTMPTVSFASVLAALRAEDSAAAETRQLPPMMLPQHQASEVSQRCWPPSTCSLVVLPTAAKSSQPPMMLPPHQASEVSQRRGPPSACSPVGPPTAADDGAATSGVRGARSPDKVHPARRGVRGVSAEVSEVYPPRPAEASEVYRPSACSFQPAEASEVYPPSTTEPEQLDAIHRKRSRVVDHDTSLPSETSMSTQYDFYGRPLVGPLYPQCPPVPRRKIYRVGTETFIGERHDHGIRVVRYLDP